MHHCNQKILLAWMTSRWKCFELIRFLYYLFVMAPAYEYLLMNTQMVELNFPFLFPCEKTMHVSLWKEQQTRSNPAKWEQSVLSLPLIPTQPSLKRPVWQSRNSVSLMELCVTSNKLKDAPRSFVLLSWREGRRRLVLEASCVYVCVRVGGRGVWI